MKKNKLKSKKLKESLSPSDLEDLKQKGFIVHENPVNGNIMLTSTLKTELQGDIKIPEIITEIGPVAFERCVNITSIDIPDSVKAIGDSAFMGCRNLKTIKLPNTIQIIGDGTFFKCENLEQIIIPDSVKKIDSEAFCGCDKLKDIKLSANLEEIESYAFLSCDSLASIDLPESLKYIAAKTCFESCLNLKKIICHSEDIYDQLQSLKFIDRLSSQKEPDDVEIILIGDEIDLGESLETDKISKFIDDLYLMRQKSIQKDGEYSLGNLIFKEFRNKGYLDNLKKLNIDLTSKELSLDEKPGDDNTEMSTSQKLEEDVESDETDDFMYYDYSTKSLLHVNPEVEGKVRVKEGIERINSYAFSDCSSITEIELPQSITDIRDYAFSECSSLESLILPDNIKQISYKTFYRCLSLKNIKLPKYLKAIDPFSFEGCSSLESIELPATLTHIAPSCVAGCYNLKYIICNDAELYSDMSDRLDVFKQWSLSKDLEIILNSETLDLSESVQDKYFQYGTDGDGNKILYRSDGKISGHIDIPSDIYGIYKDAFFQTAITSVYVPENVKQLGESAFLGCSNLREIDLSDNIQRILPYTFSDCVDLKSIKLPKHLKSIYRYAFEGCAKLESLILPAELNAIEMDAFVGCVSLEEIFCENEKIYNYLSENIQELRDITGSKNLQIIENMEEIDLGESC